MTARRVFPDGYSMQALDMEEERLQRLSVSQAIENLSPQEQIQLFNQLPPTFPSNTGLLPTATVQKIISEILAPSPGMTFAKDARDLFIECCVEFITLLSSEANEISEKDAKKTIGLEHITKALQELGFGEYVEPVMEAAQEHKDAQKNREKKQSRFEESGLTNEELLEAQNQLMAEAREKYNQQPHDEA
ncbi:MAG: hypothetical protein M1829_004302 [Trizodia sp. TS-e1964]|nr:MAG: hypothetical protein M1829_004302 [Trizodia sp. TS-e1964]